MPSFLKQLLGSKSDRDIKAIKPVIQNIHIAYEAISQLSNDGLRAKTQEFRERIKEYLKEDEEEITRLKDQAENDESVSIEAKEDIYQEIDRLEKKLYDKTQEILNEILPEAFAVIKETAKRFVEHDKVEVTATEMDGDLAAHYDSINVSGGKAYYNTSWIAGGSLIRWDMVHYDVQLIGGMVLHQGKIAEMATGEGKTLVATLPVYLNALPGKGVHIVTVNDYLARRDSEWMGMMFLFHGITVDCIDKHEPNSDSRRKAYLADITYGTNNEFGFDYLRDNMANSPMDLVQRKHNYAIVDEVDSVLIDDARTPLIISGPVPRGEDQLFDELRPKVERVVTAQKALATKFLTDARKLLASENKDEQKEGALALFRAHKALPRNKPLIKFLSEQGTKAAMQKSEEYYMADNNRLMPEATDPMYFVIDEQNNTVELTDKGIDYITGDTEDPQFFVLPDIAAQLAEIETLGLNDEERDIRKDELMLNYAVKS
ncbi:MAG: preprotein translocase subunit SecA, partial [Bacteroidales bacterium]